MSLALELNDSRQEQEDEVQEEVFETGGIVLPDRCIELIVHKNGILRLLDSRRKRGKESIKTGGRTYVPLNLHISVLDAMTLPVGRAPSGSTADLIEAIRKVFADNGIFDPAARLLAYFAVSTWFSEFLSVAPTLVITGSQAESRIVLDLLACVVRHAFPLAELSVAAFRCLRMHVQPTLLISHVPSGSWRLLSASSHHSANLPYKDGVIDLFCAKAVYAGTNRRDGGYDEPVLSINLPPFRRNLPVVRAATLQKITANFQPRLLDYRLKYFAHVRDSDFDAPEFESNLRVVARALGSCIVDAPELQAGVPPLLEGQQEVVRANRWIDPQCIAIEALLEHSHIDHEPRRVGVGELADAATAILARRGETSVSKAKEVGNQLRQLGFYPKRDSQGYAIVLNEEVRRQIHSLARDYNVAAEEQAVKSCSHCAEIVAAQN